jgi:sulfate adenylyltransferase subunit 2
MMPSVSANTEAVAGIPSQGRRLSHLAHLEAESIFVLREVMAEFERPVLLFSGGKDSIVMSHLARKAFWPGRIPFPMLHIDTGHNFPETIEYRDRWVQQLGAKLIVRTVEESIRQGRVKEETGPGASRNALQSVTLLDAISEFQFDVALGGARRDEEKARAKERFFSLRDKWGHWDPRNQRPELWSLFNSRKEPGEHFRVFPISNWTELDVWAYIQQERIEMPSLYFSHEREVVSRDGVLLAYAGCVGLKPDEELTTRRVRFRTIGDMTCTGAVTSEAYSIAEIVDDVAMSRLSERGTRADDQRSAAAMEDRKREGYF